MCKYDRQIVLIYIKQELFSVKWETFTYKSQRYELGFCMKRTQWHVLIATYNGFKRIKRTQNYLEKNIFSNNIERKLRPRM